MSTATTIAEGKYLRFVEENGYEYVERINTSGIVSILAVTDEQTILLVEQYRIPIGARTIELPCGLAGDLPNQSDEELAVAARRELLEETGFEADSMELLTEGPVSAGASTEKLTLFRAMGLTKIADGGGVGGEDIVVHEVPLDRLPDWLRDQMAAGLEVSVRLYAGLYFLSDRG